MDKPGTKEINSKTLYKGANKVGKTTVIKMTLLGPSLIINVTKLIIIPINNPFIKIPSGTTNSIRF